MHTYIRVAFIAIFIVTVSTKAVENKNNVKEAPSNKGLREKLLFQRNHKFEACAKAVKTLNDKLSTAKNSLISLEAQLKNLTQTVTDTRSQNLQHQLDVISKMKNLISKAKSASNSDKTQLGPQAAEPSQKKKELEDIEKDLIQSADSTHTAHEVTVNGKKFSAIVKAVVIDVQTGRAEYGKIMELLDRLEKHIRSEMSMYSNVADVALLKSRIAVAKDTVSHLSAEKAKVEASCDEAITEFNQDIAELDSLTTKACAHVIEENKKLKLESEKLSTENVKLKENAAKLRNECKSEIDLLSSQKTQAESNAALLQKQLDSTRNQVKTIGEKLAEFEKSSKTDIAHCETSKTQLQKRVDDLVISSRDIKSQLAVSLEEAARLKTLLEAKINSTVGVEQCNLRLKESQVKLDACHKNVENQRKDAQTVQAQQEKIINDLRSKIADSEKTALALSTCRTSLEVVNSAKSESDKRNSETISKLTKDIADITAARNKASKDLLDSQNLIATLRAEIQTLKTSHSKDLAEKLAAAEAALKTEQSKSASLAKEVAKLTADNNALSKKLSTTKSELDDTLVKLGESVKEVESLKKMVAEKSVDKALHKKLSEVEAALKKALEKAFELAKEVKALKEAKGKGSGDGEEKDAKASSIKKLVRVIRELAKRLHASSGTSQHRRILRLKRQILRYRHLLQAVFTRLHEEEQDSYAMQAYRARDFTARRYIKRLRALLQRAAHEIAALKGDDKRVRDALKKLGKDDLKLRKEIGEIKAGGKKTNETLEKVEEEVVVKSKKEKALALEVAHLKKILKAAKAKIESLNNKINEATSISNNEKLELYKHLTDDTKVAIEMKDDEINKDKATIAADAKKLKAVHMFIEKAKQIIKKHFMLYKSAVEKKKALAKQLETLTKRMKMLHKSKVLLEKKIAELKKQLSKAKGDNSDGIAKTVTHLEHVVKILSDRLDAIRNREAALANEHKERKGESNRVNVEVAGLREKLEKMAKQYEELKEKYDTRNNGNGGSNSVEKLHKTIESLEAKVASLTAQLDAGNGNGCSSKVDALRKELMGKLKDVVMKADVALKAERKAKEDALAGRSA